MRLLLVALLLYVVPSLAQWGGDSRFYRQNTVPTDSLLLWIRPDISDGKVSGDVIEDISGRSSTVIFYGCEGTDSSGTSWSPELRRWGMALDGSAADSIIATLVSIIDSTGPRTTVINVYPRTLSSGTTYATFYVSRLDTSGTSIAGNYAMSLALLSDTLRVQMVSPNGSFIMNQKIAGIFSLRDWVHLVTVYSSGRQSVYKNGELILSGTSTVKLMRTNKIRFSGLSLASTAKAPVVIEGIRLYRREITATEVKSLYNQSIYPTSRRKFSRW